MITASVASFKDALASVSIPKCDSMPVFSQVKVSPLEGSFTVESIEPSGHGVCAVTCPGLSKSNPFLLPGDLVRQAMATLDASDTIQITPAGISAEDAAWEFCPLPVDDFQCWLSFTSAGSAKMPAASLAKIIASVLYAVPVKDHRRVLNSVLLSFSCNVVTATGTNGKQLARVQAQADTSGDMAQAIVPVDYARMLSRWLEKAAGDAVIHKTEGFCAVEHGSTRISFKEVEGRFPDCNAVIPKQFSHTFTFNKAAMGQAIKRAGLVADDKSRVAVMHFKSGNCHISAMASEVGKYHGAVPVMTESEDLEISLSVPFLNETMNSFQAERVCLSCSGRTGPARMTASADETQGIRIIMPVKTEKE